MYLLLLNRSDAATVKKRKRCIKKFLHVFPNGFRDETYLSWERNYKWKAHEQFEMLLNKKEFTLLLKEKQYAEIAKRAVNIETKTNLLFSFEKMALRDAVKTSGGAKLFATALFNLVYGKENRKQRFESFTEILSLLPRKQTRVRTWPLQTVFGFIADPKEFIFLKPRVTMAAAQAYGYDFHYTPKPNWETYQSLLDFVTLLKKDISFLKPRDMIDYQSFIWVLGSDEYR